MYMSPACHSELEQDALYVTVARNTPYVTLARVAPYVTLVRDVSHGFTWILRVLLEGGRGPGTAATAGGMYTDVHTATCTKA